jgi:hypothetical protein
LGGTLAFARESGENVGTYLITPSGLTSTNYTISFNAGTLSVTKSALAVTADNKTKSYGTADPEFTVSYTGFVNSDTVASLGGTLAFARAPGENVGSYLITPGGLISSNYIIAFNTGTLSVTKSSLEVTADNKTKSYGAADPVFTVSYTAFVNSDTAASLGGTLAFARAPGESVGSYLITPNGLTSTNYDILFNTGTLAIVDGLTLNVRVLNNAGTNQITITWNAVGNASYLVQYKADMSDSAWSDAAGTVSIQNNVASITDVATAANRFYRVQVLP